jgi:ATP/maltotriose-dependent transcriptional regulator MalT
LCVRDLRVRRDWYFQKLSSKNTIPRLTHNLRLVDCGFSQSVGPVWSRITELDSRNHILLQDEPAWQRFCEAVQSFLQPGAAIIASPFAALSARERQVLSLISDGLSNTDIAERLAISEKTVRNHASNVFDKLGVWSRAQAIVFARDHGFSSLS